MKKNIPNLITLLNLLTGVIGIIFLFKGQFYNAIYLVFLAGAFDFLDGFTARLLKAYSDIGKSLDSLADIVSFGVLTGLIVFYSLTANPFSGELLNKAIPYISLFIPAFSAIRLAIFNNDPEQKTSFKGLPTPANAFLLVSASFVYSQLATISTIHTALFLIVIIIACNLMISGMKMFSLKFEEGDKKGWIRNIIFLLIAAIFIIMLGMKGIFLGIVMYILLSIIYSFVED
ncbi:MAG: CDP-alcohol phosphatidyltransferase family protein [Bacteroidales bacterium]